MVKQDIHAVGTVRLRAPFVYRFLGRSRNDYRPRHRYAIDHVEVDLPSIDRLPHPQYITHPRGEDEHAWSSWYQIGGLLMRRVMEDGIPTTLGQIERATLLVMPPRSEIEFFDDHPSAIYRIHNRRPHRVHYLPVPDVADYVVLNSDRDRRAETTRRIFEQCVEHIGTLLAPARPPTWRVRLAHDYVYLEVSSNNMPPLRRRYPAFHFPIQQEEQARAFAEQQAHRLGVPLDFQQVDRLSVEDEGQAFGGSLDTARAFGYHFCRRMAERKVTAVPADRIEMFTSFRTLFEAFGTEEHADRALAQVEDMELSDMGPALISWQAMLKLRRELLYGEADAGPAHDDPPNADDLEALGNAFP